MKTKLIGLLAIIIAASASAFTAPKKVNNFTTYKWFLITDGVAVGAQVPQADATYIQDSTTPPTESGCSGTTNQCVSGFLASQVNGSNQLKDNHQMPAQQSQEQN